MIILLQSLSDYIQFEGGNVNHQKIGYNPKVDIIQENHSKMKAETVGYNPNFDIIRLDIISD